MNFTPYSIISLTDHEFENSMEDGDLLHLANAPSSIKFSKVLKSQHKFLLKSPIFVQKQKMMSIAYNSLWSKGFIEEKKKKLHTCINIMNVTHISHLLHTITNVVSLSIY